MRTRLSRLCGSIFVVTLLTFNSFAQQSTGGLVAASTAVPSVINFNGSLADAHGESLTDVTSVTFLFYKDQTGGSPLWLETQNINPTKNGQYTATLGVTKPHGLPADVFATGEARWLAVQVAGEEEQPRVLLVAVPYALKAADAETIGGLPPSAFVLNPALRSSSGDSATPGPDALLPAAIGGTGTANFLPIFTAATTVGNSAIFQTGTGTTAKIGVNTTAPTTTLDIHGGAAVRGTLVIPAAGAATAAAGKSSQPVNMTVSTFNSGSSTAVGQTFQLRTEPVGNNTANPSATFNLLFGQGANPPAETGFKIASNGQITFAPGQTFPGGGGGGIITGVTAGTDLTGGGTTGKITLNLDTTKVPQLNTANTFTGTQTINGNELVTGFFGIGTSSPEGDIDIESTNSGQPLLINAEGTGAWAINSFGGSNGGLAGRFVAGQGTNGNTGGAGISVGGGSTSDSGTGGAGGYFYGGSSYAGNGGDGIDVSTGNAGTTREGYAGNFTGDVYISENLFASAKYFRIDHPLDPANQYFSHVSTESSEMMNIYSGNVVTDNSVWLRSSSLPGLKPLTPIFAINSQSSANSPRPSSKTKSPTLTSAS
jgi:hypothetical protein